MLYESGVLFYNTFIGNDICRIMRQPEGRILYEREKHASDIAGQQVYRRLKRFWPDGREWVTASEGWGGIL